MTLNKTSNQNQNKFLSGTTNRVIEVDANGLETASKELILGNLSNATVITQLTTLSNWNTSGMYIGTAITGTYEGMYYSDNIYYYFCYTDNIWLRVDLSSFILDSSQQGWLDLKLPMLYRLTGAGNPTKTIVLGNVNAYTWAVNDILDIDPTEQDHNFVENLSGGTLHIHIITNGFDVVDRYIKFSFEYIHVDVNSVCTINTITSPDLLIPANTPEKTQLILNMGSWTSKLLGSSILGVLKRLASTGTAPTDNIFVIGLHLHMKVDTPQGSSSIMSK